MSANLPLILKNQFGEESISHLVSPAQGDWLPLPGTGNLLIGSGATAPVDGTTGDNIAGTGSLYIAKDTGVMYIQTSLITTPVWTIFEEGNASVIAAVLTGFTQGTAPANVASTDSILAAFQKLAGNFSVTAPSLTFDHSVGAKTCTTKLAGHQVTLGVPAGAITDGLGTVCASTALAAGLRPPAAVTFPILVIDNGTTRKIGQVVVGADGVLTLSVLGTGFTNAAAAGWDAFSVTYALA